MTCYTLGSILRLMPHGAFLLSILQIIKLLCLLDILKIYSFYKTGNSQHVNLYPGLLLGLNHIGGSYSSSSRCCQSSSGDVSQIWIKNCCNFVNQQLIWHCIKDYLGAGITYDCFLVGWLCWLVSVLFEIWQILQKICRSFNFRF